MAHAIVGDDCWGDDPTVAELERRVADLLGKEAAVFVPSGTMANQIAVRVHARPGTLLATAPGTHVQVHEDASAAALSGVQVMPIGTVDGYGVVELQALIDEESCGWPPVGLVWLENTLGVAGGKLWPIEQMERIAERARLHGRPVHLDGARLWNAHIATAIPMHRFGAVADTVGVALSKGLGAPMGSLLCGSRETIARARRHKHGFGGGFRQAGIVAAAGLFALDHHLAGLADDHRRAARLADGIRQLPCWHVHVPQTNIVLADVSPGFGCAEDVCRPLREVGVVCYPNVYRQVRLVVHRDIDDDAVTDVIGRILSRLAALTVADSP